ncbi:MAG: hypothetical protein KDB73_04260 [Planctomycetes bacterium]|nr:hypothetical protein [Planctomycetota bacterium]
MAAANGLADRIAFHHADVPTVESPERVDVIVSALISKAVVGQHMAES